MRHTVTERHRRLWVGLSIITAVAAAALVAMALDDDEPSSARPPQFIEESSTAGIDHTYDGEFTFFVGGGVAAFDCDSDSRSDLFLAGGTNPASLYRNQSQVGGPLQFTEVTDSPTALDGVTGAYPIDLDGDGNTDLVVLRLGENVMMRGLGDCRFERANEAWGIDGGQSWTTAFSASWQPEDDLPTLAFGNYLQLDEAGQQFGGCADNSLIRPSPAGYEAATQLNPGWCTLSILFSDWDRSGQADLRIANDQQYYRDGQEQLWRIRPGEEPRLYTADEGWENLQIFGMGIASHDLTGDGLPEVFLTSMADNKLQSLMEGPEQPNYGDIAIGLGLTAHRPFTGDQILPSTAWHPEFQDVNNDGLIDLFISKGNVDAMTEAAMEDPNNLLLGQPDGTFTESAEVAGILDTARTRGAALVDFNLDGLLDLVYVNRREPAKLWRNLGPDGAGSGNWLAVELTQSGGNRDAIGSWIEVSAAGRTTTKEVTIGGGHAGGQLGWTHFGLGSADEAALRVQWTDGTTGPWLNVAANQFVEIRKGAAEPNVVLTAGD